jgi:cytoskeletal protein RodZ
MTALDSEQERNERLAQLGAQLREVRQQYGLTLEQVAAQTLIQPRLLQSLEEGDLNGLPEPVYIRGLLRRVADNLGLDGNEFAQAFPIPSASLPVVGVKTTVPTGGLRPIHLYLLYLGVVSAAIAGLSLLFRGGSNSVVTTNSPQPTATASPTLRPNRPSPAPTPTPISGVQAAVTLKQNSWLTVEIDGKPIFEGELPSGTQKTWKAKQQLYLRAGNAGGVMVSLNGAPAKPLGLAGQVEEVTYKAEPTGMAPTASPTANPDPATSPELPPNP